MIKIEQETIRIIVDEMLKGLSPSQRKDALDYVLANDSGIYQAAFDAIKDTVSEWEGWRNYEGT